MEYQHPAVAQRNCQHCQQFHYDEETGKPYEARDGQPMKRQRHCPPMCQTSAGCPKGTPGNSKALSDRNVQVVQFHRECQATGRFPDDPIVRQNAGLIQLFDKKVEQMHKTELSAFIKGVARNG